MMRRPLSLNIISLVIVALMAAPFLSSCSSKKNTAARRQYTAFITRYNVYYNGDTHFRETLGDMEDKYEDDYSSRLLFMHPVEAKGDATAPQPTGDFTRSIEKAQKAIQLRSIKQRPARKPGKSRDEAYKAWMKRDEYNPFLHNAWMLMGRSQYFNGDFLGAASTFFYISRHFTWLPNTVTEAKLWQARSYVSLGWLFEAEMILTRIKPETLVNKELRGLYDFTMADWRLKSDDFEGAVPYLLGAIKADSGAQRTRLYFLLGQIYARLGRKREAYEAYKKAGGGASTSYRTKFNARIKQSEVYDGADITPEVKALKRMTRYDRNKEYLDQIYYAVGNLYLSRGDTTQAIDNYRLAVEKSNRSGIDKAITQIRLGGLYFDRGEYEQAQPCYAEAVPLLPKTYLDYASLVRRSDVLDELALYSQNVTLQDSLLRLSRMTPEQQLEVVNKIIEQLKKKEKEEAEAAAREEYLAARAAEGSTLNSNVKAPNSFNINSDNSWYFYNTATRNAGRSEFQRRWGSRKLEDDWRRRNKASFNLDTGDSDDDADESDIDDDSADSGNVDDARNAEPAKVDDPHYPEYYLAQIPKDDAERATANDIIQEGLFNMGVILKDKLEDFRAAEREFDRLLADYPDNIYRLDVYYNLYLMYMRSGNATAAERYRQLILSDFPDSKYGIAMRDPAYIDNLRKMDERQQALYDQAYDAYLNNRNPEVHEAARLMAEQFPMSKIMPKFMFLDALAYVTERQSDKFTEVIRDLLDRYPDTDLTPVVASWMKGVQQGRKLQAPENGNIRGMIWDLKLGNDSVSVDTPVEFDLSPDNSQMLVMVFDAAEVPTNELLFEIARHNFKSFVVKDFDLEQMNFGRLGMVLIRGFANLDELSHYRKVMASSADFRLPPGVRPVAISVANFEKMMNEGRTFDDYFRYLEEQNYVDAQADILQPEEIETLDEADQAARPALSAPSDKSDKSDKSDSSPRSPKPDKSDSSPRSKQPQPAYDPGSEGDDPLLDE